MTKKKVSAIILTLLTLLILTVSVPPAKAQFVISSWNYPDEYGQGINLFHIYENSTGAWVEVGSSPYYANETYPIEWNTNASIKLRCSTSLNSTLTGADTLLEGRNYLRHNVTVIDITDIIIFSQQNFTYFNSGTIGLTYWYNYEVVLNFLPTYGQYYTVTVTYEVFW